MNDIFDIRDEASRAVTVAPLVTEFVGKATADIVEKYTSLYNSGRLTPEAALAGWAQIAALDRLVSEINATIARAQRAEIKEFKRAEREASN